jgi:hypothetical protein
VQQLLELEKFFVLYMTHYIYFCDPKIKFSHNLFLHFIYYGELDKIEPVYTLFYCN